MSACLKRIFSCPQISQCKFLYRQFGVTPTYAEKRKIFLQMIKTRHGRQDARICMFAGFCLLRSNPDDTEVRNQFETARLHVINTCEIGEHLIEVSKYFDRIKERHEFMTTHLFPRLESETLEEMRKCIKPNFWHSAAQHYRYTFQIMMGKGDLKMAEIAYRGMEFTKNFKNHIPPKSMKHYRSMLDKARQQQSS
jgi:hypothetical protein